MNKINNTPSFNLPVRVELSYLQQISGLYFLNDVLFTGLAYDHREQKLHKVYQITQGKITAEDDYGFFKYHSPIKINYDVIEEEHDYDYELFYQGKLFNGITYCYCDGFVYMELFWVDGYVVETISWYPDGSGLIRYYEMNYTENRCKIEWNYKQLKMIDIMREQENISFNFNNNNQIKFCFLAVDNIAHLGNLVKRDDLPLPANNLTELLAHYPLADEIKINIQRNDNFDYFINHTHFRAIKKLQLSTVHLSLPVLTQLMELPNLTSIFFKESGITDYDLNRLPAQERTSKQQQCDERNHALLTLLLAIQAKRHCQIRLDSNSGLWFDYSPVNGKIIADINQSNFQFLLQNLPLDKITQLDLRQRGFPIALLIQLAQFTHLKSLTIEEKKDYSLNEEALDKQAKALIYQQREQRNQEVWAYLKTLQLQLHCDIKMISDTAQVFERRYQSYLTH
ncbi:hypothetical protein A9G28_01860 [Gilliamella sp. Fer1-1]|uniref:hypothetical protein n=1 Tax=Gilliamella sp. Fer1-1 TaxID=3120240 RepID=UPI00080DF42D|nr:hypothetical protein [Gilliamella apicola]OCG44722.1 hypothetical protein A9G28_01860 [Gilliamella apicola]